MMTINKELIYQITRAAYERLGNNVDQQRVEQLIVDIYHAIEPAVNGSKVDEGWGLLTQSREERSKLEESSQRLVVSVFGVDRPGIVAAVAQILAEAECSIIDINQTVVQGKFAMVLIASLANTRESVANIKDRFRKEGERLGVRIYAQREDLFNAMHRV
jgi:ACT domain-containing protein